MLLSFFVLAVFVFVFRGHWSAVFGPSLPRV